SRRRMAGRLRLLLALLCCALAFNATPAPLAHANTITVTSKVDVTGGPSCTLRDAITAANTNSATGGCPKGDAGLDTITFGFTQCTLVQCIITLQSALPPVSEDLNIDGAVSGNIVTVQGNN